MMYLACKQSDRTRIASRLAVRLHPIAYGEQASSPARKRKPLGCRASHSDVAVKLDYLLAD